MFVTLKAVPNHDYWEGAREANISIKETRVPITTLEEARALCRNFISTHELGGGNWAGGAISNDKGEEIGSISYNGRAWKGKRREWNSSTKEVFSLEELI